MLSLHRNEIRAIPCFIVVMCALFFKGVLILSLMLTAAANGPVLADIGD